MTNRSTGGWLLFAMLLSAFGSSLPVAAQSSDALLKKLVEKGVLNQREANEVRDDLDKETAQNIEIFNKTKVGNWIQDLKIFGDARLRYEYRDGEAAVFRCPTALMGTGNPFGAGAYTSTTNDDYNRERWRYRLRFGADTKFTDDFSFKLRLETGAGARSTNVTFGDDGGPFNKANDGIYVGQMVLTWKPTDWCTLMGGRMENPLLTTSMVWDGDLNPEGAAEKFKRKIDDRWEVFANIAQFIYDDTNPEDPLNTRPDQMNDAWMYVQQFGVTYAFNADYKLTLAPALYIYSGPGDSFTGLYDGTGTTASAANTAVNHLMVVEIPLEFRFKLFDEKFKFWTDYAINAQGDQRARQAANGLPGNADDQVNAYQIGLQWNENKKKGDLSAKVFWQHTELYSLDPNLVDSDLFDSRLNMEGVVFGATYNFTEYLTGTITLSRAWRADHGLPTGVPGDIAGVNPLNSYELLQCDLNWKF